MRPSRHAMRTLIAAVTLLLATLLAIECASAQMALGDARAIASAEPQSTVVDQHSGPADDDCRRQRSASRSVSAPGSTIRPGHVCGCDFRTGTAHPEPGSVTVREITPKARSVGLPLLHQTLRC
jgi:hypothetical protein